VVVPAARMARLVHTIDEADDLVLSRDNAPYRRADRTQCQSHQSHHTNVSQQNQQKQNDLCLKCLMKRRAHELTEDNKIARLDRSGQLLKRYPTSMVNFTWFTDETIFAVAAQITQVSDL